MKRLDKQIEKEWGKYENFVMSLASHEFETTIKPYMIKNKYRFLAGNGTFSIIDENGKYLYAEDMPKYIQEILCQEVLGMSGNDLGSLMPDYDNR